MSFLINPYAFASEGGSLPVSDDFTRGDNSSSMGTSTSGHLWTSRVGTLGILSNQAYSSALGSLGGFAGSIATVNTGAGNCTIQVAMPTARSATTNCGLSFRYSDTGNFFTAFYKWQENALFVYNMASSSYGEVANAGFAAPPAVNGQVMKVVLNGTSIKLYVDDVLYIDTTSSNNQSATKHGIFINQLNTRLDSFSIVA